jgi:hypothetical protein
MRNGLDRYFVPQRFAFAREATQICQAHRELASQYLGTFPGIVDLNSVRRIDGVPAIIGSVRTANEIDVVPLSQR